MSEQKICEEWSLAGLADHFKNVHDKMQDHKFAWVLGAGASCSSGIPLGSDLVDLWLRELAIQHGAAGKQGELTEEAIRSWTDSRSFKALGIKKRDGSRSQFSWDRRGEFYTQIYDARYRHHPDEGFAELERLMAENEPSPGYSILASILAMQPPRHNAVVTTNFDNLVADALSIYTDSFPFVCGHEALTAFVRVSMRRPLICKIHRDLLLGPQNDTRSLRRLHDAWGTALRALFEHYTPLFIGYGGNDDTLMDLLESFDPGDIKGRPIWCYYSDTPYEENRKRPSVRIQHLVAQHNGVIVAVPDFDLLMILLGQRIEIALLDEVIEERSTQRIDNYRKKVQEVDTAEHPIVAEAVYDIYERSGGWWAWQVKAESERDKGKKTVLYEQALSHYPDHFLLQLCLARHLIECQQYDDAEAYFLSALQHRDAAKNPVVHNDYALFLCNVREAYDRAEELYREAFEIRRSPALRSNYATFLSNVREEHAQADTLFCDAINDEPEHPSILRAYSEFLITTDRIDDARAVMDKAKNLCDGESDGNATLLSWQDAILQHIRGDSIASALEEVRSRVESDEKRSSWRCGKHTKKWLRDRFSKHDAEFFMSIADVISGVREDTVLEDLLRKREAAECEAANKTARKKTPKKAAKRKKKKK